MIRFILLYKPNHQRVPSENHLGWYVHSHKTYSSRADALAAADKFLSPGTMIAVHKIDLTVIVPEITS